MINKILEDIIKKECSDKDVAVHLSGGVDSTSLAIAAQRLGKNVNTYSFHLENNPTYDSRKAEETSQLMGWKFTKVIVPTDKIKKDFHELRLKYKCIKKVHYECTFPFMYIYPKIKESIILSGIAADGHYGLSKRAMMHYKHTKELIDKFRGEYFKQSNPAGLSQQILLAKNYNKKFVAPYLVDSVIKFFKQYDWFEMNKPHEKHHVINAFPEFKTIGKLKKHWNLQLCAGVDKAFETMLECKEINYKNRDRMLDVYRDWKGIGEIRTLFD